VGELSGVGGTIGNGVIWGCGHDCDECELIVMRLGSDELEVL
jgi:hypothetical protein